MIKEIINSIKHYPVIKQQCELLEIEIKNANEENKNLDNRIRLKDMQIKEMHQKYLKLEDKRRKNASKAGGLQTSLNRMCKQNEELLNTVDELTDKLNDSTNKIDDARKMIQSLNKEIRRLKRKPALTMENLRKYERTRKSPKNQMDI